mmetsp:Transcript_70374/g.139589  ORF Transcript_70374/g.139589 Transcript_70374/m.139589 type:complete len:441 (-) Transcript_70374:59-1381(-)
MATLGDPAASLMRGCALLLLLVSAASATLRLRKNVVVDAASDFGRVDGTRGIRAASRIAHAKSGKTTAAAAKAQRRWLSAESFVGFSEAESTFDEEADRKNRGGWEPAVHNPWRRTAVRPRWYHESPSGGPNAAWQTHFPGLRAGIATRSARIGPWSRRANGQWEQAYVTADEYKYANDQSNPLRVGNGAGKLAAGWFDNSVDQVDGFGRRKFPTEGSPRWYATWQERKLNATLKCNKPGCMAKASLLAFDSKKERAARCRLSIAVKATNYNEKNWSKRVEWISVNGANVSSNCRTTAAICNKTEPPNLDWCVSELVLDRLLPANGTLEVSAKISPEVDMQTCPYKGSLLYAVPTVTCMVTSEMMSVERSSGNLADMIAERSTGDLNAKTSNQSKGSKSNSSFSFSKPNSSLSFSKPNSSLLQLYDQSVLRSGPEQQFGQ